MNSYVLGHEAERDIDEIWEYLARNSVRAADALTAEPFEAFEGLARNPAMGHRRKDLTQLPVLFWPIGNYLVIYRFLERSVEVVAVVHGKRDIPAFLRKRRAA